LGANMLELKDLTAHYGKNEVVSGANIVLNAGEVVALIGANAAGKSTTMRLIAGLKKPTRGAILFNGQDIDELPTPRRVGLGIVLVPEGRQVFVRSSVSENLAMGAYHRPDRNRIENDLRQAFALFPRLGERRGQRAGSLSGGEQQMLAIARGLMGRPKCLLLDEPTLGLAPVIVDEIGDTITKLARSGLAILLAEQNAAVALAVAHRAYVITSGRITAEGSPEALRSTPVFQQLYFGAAPPVK
jgi:branched-chain amino acid transport system ATP-binding protein